MPLNFGIESKLVNVSVSQAPKYAKMVKLAENIGLGGVTKVATKAASALVPGVRNCVAHMDAENDQFTLWKKTAQEELANRNGGAESNGLFTWVLAVNNVLPEGSFECGKNVDGSAWYACRTFRMGGLHIGRTGKIIEDLKTGSLVRKRAKFRINGSNHETVDYEVLVVNRHEYWDEKSEWLLKDPELARKIYEGWRLEPQWVICPTPFKIDDRSFARKSLISVGNKYDGTIHYVSRAEYFQVTHPAMVTEDMRSVVITFGGKEISSNKFEVLTAALVPPTDVMY